MKYLALGDSYTIGELVDPEERWPHLLVKGLDEKGIHFDLPEIIAVTGWTTDELKDGITKKRPESNFDLASLLIGVNNQYRGYPIETYQLEFEQLLESAIHFCNNRKERVFVVSIPDYGVTPFAREKEPEKIAKELDDYNQMASGICEKHNITFIDITPESKLAKDKKKMTAQDGLHPSGEMYELWVEKIFPIIYEKLNVLK